MKPYTPLVIGVCRLLEAHEGQLTLARIAHTLDAPADEIRRQVEAFADLESTADLDNYTGEAFLLGIDPADPHAEDPAPSEDDIVFLGAPATEILGLEQFDATILGPLYQAAERLLLEEPDNAILQDAAATLRQRFLPGVLRPRHYRGHRVGELARAIRERRRVRIVYSRAWNPGVTERVIEPYELYHSARGPEVDAGPLDANGEIRTFLVHRIRELEVLAETFERPSDAEARSIAARALTSVGGFVPHSGRWALDKWAERVEVHDEDAGGLTFTAAVLPPVEWRCALMMLMAGRTAHLDDPDLDAGIAPLAKRLLAHHHLLDTAGEPGEPGTAA